VQNIVSIALVAVWVVGMIALYLRLRAKQVAYLKRFPPVEGVPLYMAGGGNPFGAVSRAIWGAMVRRQPDPELEQLRHDVWRRFGYMSLWMFGFPLLAVGAATLLIGTGVIRVMAK
jgi:hypothetical protein